jgi:uncharacterized OB-fold protein
VNEPKRPLPNLQELDTREFWEATRERKLRYQRCNDCNTVVFYPRRHCTNCLSQKLIWQTASGQGTVYTFSVVRKAEHPFFHTKVPYAVAWIDLDEGPRLLSNVVGVADPAKDIRIGQRVMVDWEVHDELAVPLFKPIQTD